MISLRLAIIFWTILYVSAQSCLTFSNCTDCKNTKGCGYCDIPGGVGTCFPSVSQTLCSTVGGKWNPDTCSPPVASPCLTAFDCNSCLNQTGCGWCNLGDVGVCHSSNQTCNAIGGAFFTTSCPTGTNCSNYTTCQQCQNDGNCTSCQITPTTFTCVSAAQKDLFCPSAFYHQNASCNVSQAALTCASFTTCNACMQANGTSQSNNTFSSQPTNSTSNNSTQSNNSTGQSVSCGWCNFGSAQGGECFSTQDQGFCKNVGLWNEPCPSQGQPSTCTNVTDLHFCTGPLAPSNQTDMPWVLKLTDSYLNQRWDSIGSTVHKQLNSNGVGFCNDCWNAYKQFLCAAASPGCGMANCYQNAISSASDCIAACPCDTLSEFVVQPSCFTCVMGCTTNAVAPACGQFGLSKQTCTQLVNICGCNPSPNTVNTICANFSTNGMNVNLGNGSCLGTPTWCGLSSGNQTSNFTDVTNVNASAVSPNQNNSAIPALNNSALMQPEPGRLCPNAQICLSIYNAVGANVVANPVTTLGGVDNNGNPGTNGNGTAGNSSAVSTCANPLLLIAALFLILFV